MKRFERNTYNALRKSVTAETINVEIPVDYTHEGRQGIHEMLTIEKGLYVTGINWNSIQECYCIHYERAYGETAEGIKAAQETADIDTITEGMKWSDYTWNGYKKPSTESTETTTEEEEEEQTMKPEAIFNRIRQEVEARTERSAWSRGVTAYAIELVDELEEATKGGYFDLSDLEAPKLVDRQLLSGAADWNQYSWGGCSLIYNVDIAERLCTPSELKRTRGGERRPNSREEWLDTQARALFQASNRVKRSIRAALEV